MATSFELSIVAPDREIASVRATSVVSPGVDGYFGVWAGHVPVVSALRPGILEYIDESNNRNHVYVGGGFVQVDATKVTVLADEARMASDLDISEAEKALEEARKALRGEASSINSEDAVEEIERAMARIKAAKASR